MASTILKGAPDRDCYAVYENVVGTFSAVGDRATVERFIQDREGQSRDRARARLDLADQYGSSSGEVDRAGGWEVTDFPVQHESLAPGYTLRRRDLVGFCAKLTVDADGAVLDR